MTETKSSRTDDETSAVDDLPREGNSEAVHQRTEKKKATADFIIEQFSTMASPPVSAATLVEAEDNQNLLFIECPFHKRDGKITKLTLSPKYLRSVMTDNPIHLSATGTCHFFTYRQRIDAAKDCRPVPIKEKKFPLCVVSVIRLPRHNIRASEVGDDHLKEGAERLIVKVNLKTGMAYPKSIPCHISNRKTEERICRVVQELAAASEISVGQRVAQYSTIQSIENDPSDSASVIVKFKVPPAVSTL